MDTLYINKLLLYGHTGFYPEEKVLGVQFRLDLELVTALRRAGETDDLRDTVDYGTILKAVSDLVAQSRFNLVEKLATEIARVVLEHPKVETVRVHLTKCHPPLPFGDFNITVSMERDRDWVEGKK
ncbi:dihydroneopterin aldolase [Anthocerotibacter panamensis]|uniref:dihydroneopterin aldolase n=1 Tax=Anthocerotibacter panamensis TaxID=2857077 RepID=UPI001C407E84|nr:dihydroneopterin aldolase [Anthocerotibacter panamensis]